MFCCLSNAGAPSFMQKQPVFHTELFTVWLSLQNFQKMYKKFAVSCQYFPLTFIFPEDFLTASLFNHSLIFASVATLLGMLQ